MRWMKSAGIVLCAIIVAGCVSPATHKRTKAELETLRVQLAEEQARAADRERQLEARLAGLEEDKAALSSELLAAQSAGSQSQSRLESVRRSLEREQSARREYESQLGRMKDDHLQAVRLGEELRRERDGLRSTSEDLQRQLETARKEMENRTLALAQAEERLAGLDADKARVEAELSAARTDVRDLTVQLAAERENVARISEEKQRLMSGTTTAQEEIGRLQNRVGELEAVAARARDLEQRLSERDQEIGRLREAAADRGSLAMKATALAEELDTSKQRVAALTGELATLTEEANRLRQERDQYVREVSQLRQDVRNKDAEIQRLAIAQRDLMDSLNEVKAEKEAEIRRLTRAQEALNESLRSEIAKGDIRIKQVRDQLTINMVDRILFDSGRAELKAQGLEVLKRVSDVLKQIDDKQIRIEGHTDNVPIGPRIKDRFPTNWELSTARATSVVRYLVDQGGINADKLTAAGHADTMPVAQNDTEQGRQANRRIEIVLFPKNLPGIVQNIGS